MLRLLRGDVIIDRDVMGGDVIIDRDVCHDANTCEHSNYTK